MSYRVLKRNFQTMTMTLKSMIGNPGIQISDIEITKGCELLRFMVLSDEDYLVLFLFFL